MSLRSILILETLWNLRAICYDVTVIAKSTIVRSLNSVNIPNWLCAFVTTGGGGGEETGRIVWVLVSLPDLFVPRSFLSRRYSSRGPVAREYTHIYVHDRRQLRHIIAEYIRTLVQEKRAFGWRELARPRNATINRVFIG